MNTVSLLIFTGILVAGAVVFRLDTRPASVPEDPSFRDDVFPILVTGGCVGCHGQDGGLSVRSVRALLAGGDEGPAVIPGHPDSSLLVMAIMAQPLEGPLMPPDGPPVPRASIEVIKAWIEKGAKDN